jgi:hypothetical protein
MDKTEAHSPQAPAVQVAPSRYVTIELAAAITGYSPGAIRQKIHQGVWLENRQFIRSADGRVLIDMKGYEKWVEKGQE